MDKNTKILLYGGLSVVALILIHSKISNMNNNQKIVSFEPTSVEKMPWVGVPNSLPEIKIDGKQIK